MIEVNVKAFKKLRKYIAENVRPSQIYMEDWFKERIDGGHPAINTMLKDVWCGTAACLYGHGVYALLPKSRRNGLSISRAVREVGMLLLNNPIDTATPVQLCNKDFWPLEQQKMYATGSARQKKAALLAVLDRVIENGCIDWVNQ